MSKIISGKEALIALANDEKVLISRSHHWDNLIQGILKGCD